MKQTRNLTSQTLGSVADYTSGNFHNKQFIFILNHKNQNPSYQSNRGTKMHYPPSVRFKLVGRVFDEDKKMMRDIRYIPGELSIFKDEQTPDDKVSKKEFSLEFIDGEKIIAGTDTLLIQYLMISDKNGSKPKRDTTITPFYFTVDPGVGLQSVIDTDEQLSEAQHFCYKGDWDEVAAYAMVLNINMDRDPREIRYALRQIAGKDPVAFLAGMKNPSFKRKFYILEALNSGIIVKNPQRNSIEWKNSNGNAIVTAPIGRDPVDYFTEATFTTDGERQFAAIMDILGPIKKDSSELTNTPSPKEISDFKRDLNIPKDIISMADITNMKLAELISKGVEQGVIVKNGAWSTFEDKKYQGEDLMREIKGNEDLLRILQEKLN